MTVLPLLLAMTADPLGSAVIYEANLRAEAPKGAFRHLTQRLPSIKALGVTVVWLMPVTPVGQMRKAGELGSPYAPAAYDRVNPEFGTETEFRKLVETAHRLNLRIILDWVANHTAWDHPWIKSHPEWYTRDAKGDIQIPGGTNWNDVADLNYDNPSLRQAMVNAMDRWVQRYNIDGFRCDTADYVPYEFWSSAISDLRKRNAKPLLMLAEGFRSDHYQAGFDLTYSWPFWEGLREVLGGKPATELKVQVAKERDTLTADGQRMRFTTNHDKAAWEGTPTEFFGGPSQSRLALLLVALGGGVPMVYSGQEVGYDQRIPIFSRSHIDWTPNAETKWLTKILSIRRSVPAFRSIDADDHSTKDAIIVRRRSGKSEAWVLVNPRPVPVTIDLPSEIRGRWQDRLVGFDVEIGATITLDPLAARVLTR